MDNKLTTLIMHQSIETPTPWVPGKGMGFDIDLGQKVSMSLPPEAVVQIKRPYPWGKKVQTIKSFKEKQMHLNGEILNVRSDV